MGAEPDKVIFVSTLRRDGVSPAEPLGTESLREVKRLGGGSTPLVPEGRGHISVATGRGRAG